MLQVSSETPLLIPSNATNGVDMRLAFLSRRTMEYMYTPRDQVVGKLSRHD